MGWMSTNIWTADFDAIRELAESGSEEVVERIVAWNRKEEMLRLGYRPTKPMPASELRHIDAQMDYLRRRTRDLFSEGVRHHPDSAGLLCDLVRLVDHSLLADPYGTYGYHLASRAAPGLGLSPETAHLLARIDAGRNPYFEDVNYDETVVCFVSADEGRRMLADLESSEPLRKLKDEDLAEDEDFRPVLLEQLIPALKRGLEPGHGWVFTSCQ